MNDHDDELEAPPPPQVLTAMPEVVVARVTLGLTAYLDEPTVWAQEAASAMLVAFADLVGAERLAWCTTTMIPDWHRVSPSVLQTLVAQLSDIGLAEVRHLMGFRIVDDVQAPSVSFAYREVDNAREGRASWLELRLPADHSPDDLLQLALQLGHEWPVLHAVGGWTTSCNAHERPTAGTVTRAWAKRYWGLDVQEPESSSWEAERALSGTGWLTLLGRRFLRLRGLDVEALAARAWPEGVSAMRLRGGVLLQAGPTPTLGDMNRLAFPHAYASVARALADHLPTAAPDLHGRWFAEEDALAWARRFVEPEGWR